MSMSMKSILIDQNANDLPFIPVSISWHNITVSTKQTKSCMTFLPKRRFKSALNESRDILKNVSGEVKAGQLLAILGSSGAGKTTLLNILTARNLNQYNLKGIVKLNGQTADKKAIKHVSAYVQQKDIFIANITVREHLMFQILLRMGSKMNSEQRNARIDELLEKYSLVKCRDTLIGSNITMNGISGGETKRLSFASESLTDPSLMICDEPTSGLDSFMAKNIVEVMKSMANEGQTVICTIHQPSSQVFEMFEHILLMADGRVAFMGTTGDAEEFFSSIGRICPKKIYPSDFYIEQLAIISGQEMESKIKVNDICNQFDRMSQKQSEVVVENFNFADIYNRNNNKSKDYWPKMFRKLRSGLFSKYKSGFFFQLIVLLWRNYLITSRNKALTWVKMIQNIFFAILFAVMYANQTLDQIGVNNIGGVLYLSINRLCLQYGMFSLKLFVEDIPIVLREHNSRLYGLTAYFISRILPQIPFMIINPFVFFTIVYFSVGLYPSAAQFFLAQVVIILSTFMTASFGYLLSSFVDTLMMGTTLFSTLFIVLGLFSGYTLNSKTFPTYLTWIKYLSPAHYAFESLIVNQWKNIDYVECGTNSTTVDTSCMNTGLDVIEYYGFDEKDFNLNLILMTAISLALTLMGFIGFNVKLMRK